MERTSAARSLMSANQPLHWGVPSFDVAVRLPRMSKGGGVHDAQPRLLEPAHVNELGLEASLRLCLGSTNIFESGFSGTRGRTRRVTKLEGRLDGSSLGCFSVAVDGDELQAYRGISLNSIYLRHSNEKKCLSTG